MIRSLIWNAACTRDYVHMSDLPPSAREANADARHPQLLQVNPPTTSKYVTECHNIVSFSVNMAQIHQVAQWFHETCWHETCEVRVNVKPFRMEMWRTNRTRAEHFTSFTTSFISFLICLSSCRCRPEMASPCERHWGNSSPPNSFKHVKMLIFRSCWKAAELSSFSLRRLEASETIPGQTKRFQ